MLTTVAHRSLMKLAALAASVAAVLILPGAGRSVGCGCLQNGADDPSWISPGTLVYTYGGERNVFIRDLDGAPRRLTDERVITTWPSSRAATVSPAHDLVAFRSDRGLAVVAPTGGSPRILDPDVGEGPLAFSPDGGAIAYRGRAGGLRVIATAGGGTARILSPDGYAPAWSSDARTIAYLGRGGLRLIASDGTNDRPLSPGGVDAGLTWAPNGPRLAFARGGAIWLADTALGTLRRLVPGAEPRWMPDGASLVYVGPNHDIRLVGTDGRLPRVVLESAQEPHHPVPSPDASHIAYIVRNPVAGDGPARISTDDIYVVNVDGSGRRELTGYCGIGPDDDPEVVCLDRGVRSVGQYIAGPLRLRMLPLRSGSASDGIRAVRIRLVVEDAAGARVRGALVVARGPKVMIGVESTRADGFAGVIVRAKHWPVRGRVSVTLSIEAGARRLTKTISFRGGFIL